jgi:hypothetical protein
MCIATAPTKTDIITGNVTVDEKFVVPCSVRNNGHCSLFYRGEDY